MALGMWLSSIQGLLQHAAAAAAAALWLTQQPSTFTHEPQTLAVASCGPTSPSLCSESAPTTFFSLSPAAERRGLMLACCRGRSND